jgi:putative solute:sodium symporter small subunit
MQMPRAPLHGSQGPETEAVDAVDGLGIPAGAVFPPDLHGSHHLKLKALLLAVWVVVSFGTCYFARDLQALAPGWPIAYWMAAQGALLMFLAIIVVYCAAMDYFERQPQTRDTPAGRDAAAPSHPSSKSSLPHV